MQSAQAISAAYYFDLAARDYILADGAIELVIEGVPCSAFIEPSQSCELIFCARLDRLRGRNHAADAGKFRRDLQEQSRRDEGQERGCHGFYFTRIKLFTRLVWRVSVEALTSPLSAHHPTVKIIVFISLDQTLAMYRRTPSNVVARSVPGSAF
jgi:hypothetical protein